MSARDYRGRPELRDRRNAERRRIYQKTAGGIGKGSVQGLPWTRAEIEAVHRRAVTDTELAARIGRSVQAIQLKRLRTAPPLALS